MTFLISKQNWTTWRSARNVKDTWWPIVPCFSNIQRTYQNMDVDSVHNASCLYVHFWAQERDKRSKVCLSLQRCTIHRKDFVLWLPKWNHHSCVWHGKEPPSQRTAIWRLNASAKISLTKLGNKKFSSWATTDFPHDPTMRMTRSHAPFAQTFPSAKETATTKPPHRRSRNVKDTCWPIVTCFSNIQRTYKNMDAHSVHNASCLYVHVWAQERDEKVDYSFVAAELQNPLQRFCSLTSKQRPQLMCWHK